VPQIVATKASESWLEKCGTCSSGQAGIMRELSFPSGFARS